MNIIISSSCCLIFMLIIVNGRIICPKNGDRLQQRSLCRQRFMELKNNNAYRSMLQAIADRRVPLAGSIAAFQQPSTALTSSSSNQQIDEEVHRPLTTYQDIMHNLLMKMP